MDCRIPNRLGHFKLEVRDYYKWQAWVIPKTKIRTDKLSLTRKLAIAEEATNADDINAIASKYKVFTAQVKK